MDAPNPYRKRLEDIDPARAHPGAEIEYVEQVRPRPSPFTVEGYVQGFRDLAEAAVDEREPRRSRARLLIWLVLAANLLALLVVGASQLVGLF